MKSINKLFYLFAFTIFNCNFLYPKDQIIVIDYYANWYDCQWCRPKKISIEIDGALFQVLTIAKLKSIISSIVKDIKEDEFELTAWFYKGELEKRMKVKDLKPECEELKFMALGKHACLKHTIKTCVKSFLDK